MRTSSILLQPHLTAFPITEEISSTTGLNDLDYPLGLVHKAINAHSHKAKGKYCSNLQACDQITLTACTSVCLHFGVLAYLGELALQGKLAVM